MREGDHHIGQYKELSEGSDGEADGEKARRRVSLTIKSSLVYSPSPLRPTPNAAAPIDKTAADIAGPYSSAQARLFANGARRALRPAAQAAAVSWPRPERSAARPEGF